jgi:hypothetical protein
VLAVLPFLPLAFHAIHPRAIFLACLAWSSATCRQRVASCAAGSSGLCGSATLATKLMRLATTAIYMFFRGRRMWIRQTPLPFTS